MEGNKYNSGKNDVSDFEVLTKTRKVTNKTIAEYSSPICTVSRNAHK